jgi:carbon storage regulator CsrA
MLVLSRKLEQEICIGDEIRIRIVKIKGNTVRIGIEAPGDVKVIRGELAFDPKPSDQEELPAEETPIEDSNPAVSLNISAADQDAKQAECQYDQATESTDAEQILPMIRPASHKIFPATTTRMQEWVQQVTKPR